MKTKEWISIVIVVIVVAVLASLITANITGNVIKVSSVTRGTEVYTKAEVDSKLNTLDTKISAVDKKIDNHIWGVTTPPAPPTPGMVTLLPITFKFNPANSNQRNSKDKNGATIFYDTSVGTGNKVVIKYNGDAIVLDGDNSANVFVEFTSELNPSSSKRIVFAHDTDGTGDSKLNLIRLANANNNTIHVVEGEAAYVNEYIVVNSNNEGRILQVKSLPTGTSSTDNIQVDDIVSGETFRFITGYKNYTESAQTIGGGEYWASININRADRALSTVKMVWGAGARASASGANVGTEKTIAPKIGLANGNSIALGYVRDIFSAYKIDNNQVTSSIYNANNPAVLFIESNGAMILVPVGKKGTSTLVPAPIEPLASTTTVGI
ncbi:MAG: hypothetical protein NT076_04885 [Candidatus Pacearchaeota archaeon]|nr:hypothetical protein [Candidatus Pacearchaeota archaeon]